MKKDFIKKIIQSPLFIITVLVCAANWQLFFCVKGLQWDIMNFWYPWRYFIADCYNNGIVPLWDPYTQGGYPVHGDLQGPAYNPETIISSFLFNGSLYYLNYLFIGYLIVGAYGFYKLSSLFIKLISQKNEINFLHIGPLVAGVAYALSGYNTGYGHYLYITVSVCLIPWLYYYVIKILTNGTYLDSCKLAVFLFLQITAGNPSFLIVSGYFFFAIVCIQFIRWIKQKEARKIIPVIKYFSSSVFVMIILCLPVFINAYHVFPETTRGNGISLEWAAEERFALRNFFTFFTPLISLEREYQSGLNQPIFDYYIGITTLFFACIGFIKFRSFWINIFCGIAIISFLLSIGLRTPVFGWFHSYLPFFNVFRMPRLIFLYDQIFLLLMTALGITYLLSNKINIKWFLLFIVFSFVASIISVFYFKFYYRETGTYVVDHSSLRYYLWSEAQYPKALVSCVITGIVLIISLIFYWRNNFKLLLFVLLADVMINYSLGAISRNFSETDADVTQSYVQNTPKGFAPPENIVANKVKTLTRYFNEFWLNTSIFIKQPCYWNDNNFELTNYFKLYIGKTTELNYFTNQSLFFFADSLVRSIDSSTVKSTKTLAIVDSVVYEKNKNISLVKSIGDTIICKKFEPHNFIFKIKNKEMVAFVLQQNFTKLWHVYLDGNEIKHDLCFYSFPFIKLNGGVHTIEFSYQVPHYKLYFGISLLVFVIIIFLVLFRFKFKRTAIISFALLVLFCSFKFYNGNKNREVENLTELQQTVLSDNEYKSKSVFVMNTRDTYFSQTNKTFTDYNFIYPEDVAAFSNQLSELKNEYLCFVNYKTYFPPEVDVLINTVFGEKIKTEKTNFGFASVYKRNPQKQNCIYEKDFSIKNTNPTGIEIKKGKEYGPTFVFKVNDIGAKKYDLIFAEADVECGFADFKGLCISVDNNEKNKKFLSYNFIHHPELKQQKLSLYYRLPEFIKPDDEIKVFLWNDDERVLLLKDFKMKVIKSEAFGQ